MAKNKPTGSNDKVAAARKQAQQQVKAQERRTASFIAIGAAAVLVLFGGIVYFIIQQGSVPSLEDAHSPQGADLTGGIVIGQDGAAGGEPPADVPRVDIYFDFMCSYCSQFDALVEDDIHAMVENGDIALYYHPISILDRNSQGTKYSTRAAAAAAAIADDAPEHLLSFVSALLANQPVAQNNGGLSDDEIEQIAIEAGVPEDVAGSLADGEFSKWVTAASDQSSQDGVPGTPAIMVNRELIDQQQDVPYFEPGALREYLEGM